MTNKIVARVLTYKLGLLSYGDSKLDKWKNFTKDSYVSKPGLWRTGFFRCSKECHHFQQELIVSKAIVLIFS